MRLTARRQQGSRIDRQIMQWHGPAKQVALKGLAAAVAQKTARGFMVSTPFATTCRPSVHASERMVFAMAVSLLLVPTSLPSIPKP